MNTDDFKKIVEHARAQGNIYENADFWQAVITVGRSAARKYSVTATAQEKECIMSDLYTRLLKLRKRTLDECNSDIFYDYPAERLLYTIIGMAKKAAISAFKKTTRKKTRELSLSAEIKTDGDGTLTVADTIADSAPSPDAVADIRTELRDCLNPDALDKLIGRLDIKRRDFCDAATSVITADDFIAALDPVLSVVFCGSELDPFYSAIRSRGAVNITKLHNRIYNENRKETMHK